MSGFEVAGIVLGSVPLVLELFDRGGAALKTISRFKHHVREVEVYQQLLGTQKDIFLCKFAFLKSTIEANQRFVREIRSFKSDNDPFSEKGALKRLLDGLEGQAAYIGSELRPLCSKWDGFSREVRELEETEGPQRHINGIKIRLQVAFSAANKEQEMARLQNLNTSFLHTVEIITTTLQRPRGTTYNDTMTSRSPGRGIAALPEYRQAWLESKHLHSTLSKWLCPSSQRHLFQVRIPDQGLSTDTDPTTQGHVYTLEFAVSHDNGSATSHGETMLIEVQRADSLCPATRDAQTTVVKQQDVCQQTKAEPSNLIGVAELLWGRTQTKLRAFLLEFQVGFIPGSQPSHARQNNTSRIPETCIDPTSVSEAIVDSASEAIVESASEAIVDSTSVNKLITDLMHCSDFCGSVERKVPKIEHRFYLGPWNSPPGHWYTVPCRGPFQSLHEFLCSVARNRILNALAPLSKIDVARRVAEGIMQFYSTPWLAQTDLSANIYGSGFDFYQNTPLAGNFYFMCMSNTNLGKGKQPKTLMSTSSIGVVKRRGGRNMLLFSFGILLLEVGLECPWDQLKQTFQRQQPSVPESSSDDVEIADRLAEGLKYRMGSDYTRITRKCIHCDFGTGHANLDTDELQGLFVEEVVLKLRDLRVEVEKGLSIVC